MRQWKHLQKVQRKLLREVRDGNELVSVVRKRLKVDEKRFARWLRSSAFSSALDDAQEQARHRARRELKSASTIARTRMAEGLLSEAPMEPRQRLYYKQLFTCDDRDEQREREAQKKSLAEQENSPIHPDFTGKIDDLLDVLEGQKGVSCEQNVQ